MQGLTAEGARRREIRREHVRALYDDGQTIAAIADQVEASQRTVIKDVDALATLGRLRKRARGEAIATGVSRYWQSAEGREEARRRSETLRSEPPIERKCEWCGDPFELASRRGRQQPGRFCSDQCRHEWNRSRLREEAALEPLREGRHAWRARSAAAKEDALTLDEVSKRLPCGLRRTHGALIHHIADGGLQAVWDAEFGRWLVSEDALAEYLVWLRNHRDGRLRRFADLRFRARWLLGRHGKTDGFGALGGRPARSILDDDHVIVDEIRGLHEQGRSAQHIAHILSGRHATRITRKMIRRQLARLAQ